jgi:hypothetical protein
MNTRNIAEVIVETLTDDVDLVGMLAEDTTITGNPPALYQGTQTTAPPIYPSITYRLPDYLPNPAFRPTAAEGGGESPISDQWLEMEVWARDGHDTVRDIGDQVVAILEGRMNTALAAGRIFQAELTTRINDGYRADLELYFGLLRFRLRLDTTP